jgi:ABC-type branched-subunit amino acid transport system substrate-binding protein
MPERAYRYSDLQLGGVLVKRLNGGGMRMQGGLRTLGAATMAGAVALLAGAMTLSGTAAAGASAPGAPGVTPTSITVGSISTQTGTLASNFASLIYGEKAYFDYVNAPTSKGGLGGINGRKINYAYQLDDGGSPTTFNQLANTLINQDHVFAVTGMATAFFSPNLFVEAKIPTYGYDVTGNWEGPKNLFGAGGSVEYYPAETPEMSYVAKKAHAKSIGVLAYNFASSAEACQTGAQGLSAAGYNVSYTDYKIGYPGTTVGIDVQRMKQAGVDMVISCMDVQGNITMARAIQQYGLHVTQLWFNGNDKQTLAQNESLMQGVYFDIGHVPFSAPVSVYPGLKLYLTEMKKYAPKYVEDEVAIQGWESASLFVAGVKAAGKDLTQANVIAQDNKLSAFTAGGLTAPVNWVSAGHTGNAPPYCAAYIQAEGTQYVPALNTGKNVFNCFESVSAKKGPVFPVPTGTPAPR